MDSLPNENCLFNSLECMSVQLESMQVFSQAMEWLEDHACSAKAEELKSADLTATVKCLSLLSFSSFWLEYYTYSSFKRGIKLVRERKSLFWFGTSLWILGPSGSGNATGFVSNSHTSMG